MYQYRYTRGVANIRKLDVKFFRSEQGNEPVKEWLRALPPAQRKTIGDDIRTVQFGWPLGMPLVEKIERNLWEVRCGVDDGIARVLFTTVDDEMVLLHGIKKKSRKLPKQDVELARSRMRLVRK